MISCSEPTPRRPITHKSSTFLNESVEFNKKLNLAEEKLIKDYISKDSLSFYNISPYGFWFKYLNKNSSDSYTPKEGDVLEVEYEISNLSNEVLYSSEASENLIYKVDKQEIINGLQKGLKLLKRNEEVVFIFPSFNAYGKTGDGDRIGIHQPIIYKVKIIKINN